MKRKPLKSLWQRACEYEAEQPNRGGMATIFNYLAAIHPTTDAARSDLAEAWQRYNDQMRGQL